MYRPLVASLGARVTNVPQLDLVFPVDDTVVGELTSILDGIVSNEIIWFIEAVMFEDEDGSEEESKVSDAKQDAHGEGDTECSSLLWLSAAAFLTPGLICLEEYTCGGMTPVAAVVKTASSKREIRKRGEGMVDRHSHYGQWKWRDGFF